QRCRGSRRATHDPEPGPVRSAASTRENAFVPIESLVFCPSALYIQGVTGTRTRRAGCDGPTLRLIAEVGVGLHPGVPGGAAPRIRRRVRGPPTPGGRPRVGEEKSGRLAEITPARCVSKEGWSRVSGRPARRGSHVHRHYRAA